jgi:hypothetical protein
MVMHDGSVLHCNIHIWDAVLTEYWPAIVVWLRIELPDTSAHNSGSIDSVESDWERAIDFYLEKVNNHEPIARATSREWYGKEKSGMVFYF